MLSIFACVYMCVRVYEGVRVYVCMYVCITSPGGNTPQDTNCTATCPLSRKLFKLDEPDMQDTAGKAGTNS